jgi:ribose transport system substrate-binding protein
MIRRFFPEGKKHSLRRKTMKKSKILLICVLALVLISPAVFCGGSRQSGSNEATASKGINIMPLVDDGTGVIMQIGDAKGPNGEKPASVEDVLKLIPPEKVEQIRKANYTAAVSLHTTNADWSILQEKGIRAVLDQYNIKLLTVTDAQMKVDKQISDLESIIAMKPSLLISFVIDADAIGPSLRKATAAGIKLSLIDSVPSGFKSPQDYAGMGTADNYANGKASAQKLADYLGGKGEVVLLKAVTSMFHTDQREQGARDVFAKYPDIKIVAEMGVDSADSAATAIESMLTAHPNIKGVWSYWDGPAMGAAGVIETMGRKDIKITTVDLSEDSAYSIATGGALLATGSQHPYEQGVAEAMIGVAALAGVPTPSYVLVPGEIVTRESMVKSWDRVFQTPLPTMIADALKK